MRHEKDRRDFHPPPAKDSSAELTRWTRPTIHELGRVQGTEGGPQLEESENTYNRPDGS